MLKKRPSFVNTKSSVAVKGDEKEIAAGKGKEKKEKKESSSSKTKLVGMFCTFEKREREGERGREKKIEESFLSLLLL